MSDSINIGGRPSIVKGALSILSGVASSAANAAAASAANVVAGGSSLSAADSGKGPSTPARNTAAVNSSFGSEKNPEDIPKEDLIHLCMKMNKRMQAMETKGQELVKKRSSLISERSDLLEIIKSLTSLQLGATGDQELDVAFMRERTKEWDASRRAELSSFEKRISDLEEAKEKEMLAADARHRREITDLQQSLHTASSNAAAAAQSTDNNNNNSSAVASNDLASDVTTSEADAGRISFLTAEVDRLMKANEEVHASLMEAQSKARKTDSELDRLKKSEESTRNQVVVLEGSLQERSTSIEDLRRELDAIKNQSEEKVLYLQMQLNSVKGKDETKDREVVALKKQLEDTSTQIAALHLLVEEKEIAVKSNKEIVQAVEARLSEVESDLAFARERIKENDRHHNAQAVMKAEQEALLLSMRRDLKDTIESREEALHRVRELEEYRIKTEGQLMKLASLTEQVSRTQTELEDKNSLIVRLRAEAQTADRNHAMKTAMLATCEAQLEALKGEINLKEDTVKETVDRVTSLQTRLAGAEARLEERVREANETVAQLHRDAAAQASKHLEAIEEMKIEQEQALDVVRKDFAKKSSLARALMSEKEEEVRVLSSKVQELQEEIRSGAPNERRIFELAQEQARRETTFGLHSDARELAFRQLQATLAARDMDLARVQQSHATLVAEVSELRRHTKREGVNMDYLKNVVLQSPERTSLVPVLAMLLQFNPKELTLVERAAKEPIWSQLPVKEVKRSLSRAAAYGNGGGGFSGGQQGLTGGDTSPRNDFLPSGSLSRGSSVASSIAVVTANGLASGGDDRSPLSPQHQQQQHVQGTNNNKGVVIESSSSPSVESQENTSPVSLRNQTTTKNPES